MYLRSKQKIIIFEGVDHVGKSTISQALSNEIGVPVFKNPREKRGFQLNELMMMTRYAGLNMMDFLQVTGYSCIFDRAFPSEYAYGRTYKREIEIDVINELDRGYAKLGAVYIYLYKDGHAGYKDDLIDFSYVAEIKRRYLEFFDRCKCPWMMLETSSQDIAYQLGSITSFLRDKKVA